MSSSVPSSLAQEVAAKETAVAALKMTLSEVKRRAAAVKSEHDKCKAVQTEAERAKAEIQVRQRQIEEAQNRLTVFKEQESKLLVTYRTSEKEAEAAEKQFTALTTQLSLRTNKQKELEAALKSHDALSVQLRHELDASIKLKEQRDAELRHVLQIKSEVRSRQADDKLDRLTNAMRQKKEQEFLQDLPKEEAIRKQSSSSSSSDDSSFDDHDSHKDQVGRRSPVRSLSQLEAQAGLYQAGLGRSPFGEAGSVKSRDSVERSRDSIERSRDSVERSRESVESQPRSSDPRSPFAEETPARVSYEPQAPQAVLSAEIPVLSASIDVASNPRGFFFESPAPPKPSLESSAIANEQLSRISSVMPQGLLYDSEHLQIGFQVMTQGPAGRALVFLGNKSADSISEITIDMWSPEGLELTVNLPFDENSYATGQQTTRMFMFQLKGFYNKQPKVSFSFKRAETSEVLVLQLPLPFSRFLAPLKKSGADIWQQWVSLAPAETKVSFNSLSPDIKSMRELAMFTSAGGAMQLYLANEVPELGMRCLLSGGVSPAGEVLALVEVDETATQGSLIVRAENPHLRATTVGFLLGVVQG
jgi:hypothetical protein